MARADHPAFDSEALAQPDVQSVGEHDEARGNFLAIGQNDLLPFRTGRNGCGLGVDRFDPVGYFGPNGVDQRVIHDAVLPARPLVEQVAEARNPVLAVMGRGAKRRFRNAGPAKAFDLEIAAELFDPKIGRIDRMRVDQNGGNTGAPEHGRRGRASKAAANDGNIGVFHGLARVPGTMIAPGEANKPLASRWPFDRMAGRGVPWYITRVISESLVFAPVTPGPAEEGSVRSAQRFAAICVASGDSGARLKLARTSVMQTPEGFLSLSFRLDLATRRR